MARILIVDDDRTVRHMVSAAFRESDVETSVARDAEDALRMLAEEHFDVVLLDIELPGLSGLEAFRRIQQLDGKLPVIFITGGGTSDTAIEAMKLGAYDYLLKPLNLTEVEQLVGKAIKIRRLMSVRVEVEEDEVAPDDQGEQIVGRSPAMQQVFKSIGRVASQNVTVLIRGESGTGKELVARAIYQHSARAEGPFLAVNCAAIPEHLLESQLFGHEKGSFTGADRQRIGNFEQCNGGTIFLDEVGDMPAPLQSKMLRVLQQQSFQRVGGGETIKTDVRIIAATNCDLEAMVTAGSFREDLLYRLNGYSIEIPPLRERKDDIILLLKHFLARISKEIGKHVDSISPEALQLFREYDWPGNVRELEASVRQALLQTQGTVVTPDFLPFNFDAHRQPDQADPLSETQGQSPDSMFDLPTFVTKRLSAESTNVYAETLEIDGAVSAGSRPHDFRRQSIRGSPHPRHHPRQPPPQDPVAGDQNRARRRSFRPRLTGVPG